MGVPGGFQARGRVEPTPITKTKCRDTASLKAKGMLVSLQLQDVIVDVIMGSL